MPKVLMIEDEEVLREAFSIIMSTLPYDADVAPNGEVALAMCHKTSYDLIFLDLMMPIMNGADFLNEFEKMPQAEHTKVIILSNLSSSQLLEQAMEHKFYRSILKSDVSPAHFVHLIHDELSTAAVAVARS